MQSGTTGYKIVEDAEYGYKRLDPIPTQEEVEQFYKEEFYSTSYKQFNNSSLDVQEKDEGFFNSRWERIYEVCERLKGPLEGFTVLDIGCGFAKALRYFKDRGMKVTGLEPCQEGVDYAVSQGLDVRCSGIEDFSTFGGKRYQVVTLLNVLEHLRQPYETLLRIKSELLDDDGLLVVNVPNEFNVFQTVANKEYSLNEWWVTPPNHINYFSATSLKQLVENSGYKVTACEATFPLEMFILMGDIYVGNPETGKICHKRRVQFESLMRKHGKRNEMYQLYEALAKLNLGRQVTVYAEPR